MDDLWLPSDEELALLSDEEVAELAAALERVQEEDAKEFHPQPKQRMASDLAEEADELLYGGAAGGGKTYWLVNYALQEMLDHPNNYGAIFRRVYKSIIGTVLLEAQKTYPLHGARWNEQKQRWFFPNGSQLIMSSLEHETSVTDYQGQQFGFLGFEEVTEFTETQVGFMISRLRAPAPGIRPHLAATANPGGLGHRWVKRRWVKPKPQDVHPDSPRPEPFAVWRPADVDGQRSNTRAFVPATLEDNPALLERDPGYARRLAQIVNKNLRKAMRTGDWDAIDQIEGALWNSTDLERGRVDRDKTLWMGVQRRVLAIDPSDGNEDGKGDEFGVAVVSLGLDGVCYVEHVDGWRASPRQMAKAAIDVYHKFACDEIVIEKNFGGKWVPAVIQMVDRYANCQLINAADGKITRARPVAALFEPTPDNPEMPYRARMAGWFEEAEEELCTFTGKPGEPSPNRLDAIVWGVSRLALGARVLEQGGQYDDQRHSGRR